MGLGCVRDIHLAVAQRLSNRDFLCHDYSRAGVLQSRHHGHHNGKGIKRDMYMLYMYICGISVVVRKC